MTSVVFRPEAEADLTAIALFIAEHSVERAQAFVHRLRKRCSVLETSPLAGRARPELGVDLRSLFERPYVLIYRVDGDKAEIVAILHAARDLPATVAARIAGKLAH
jgi:toxin ParE1/3/4